MSEPTPPPVSSSGQQPGASRPGLDGSTSRHRNLAIDVLRGVAVLGILLINIEDFGLPHSDKSAAGTEWVGTYLPGDLSRHAVFAWTLMRALFEGKMRAIFSMLFGAGIVLLTSRLDARRSLHHPSTADIYYRRTLWLLAFGMLHAYLLWEGDILYSYAICGLFLFPFRNLPGRTLVIVAALMMGLSIPRAAVVASHRQEIRLQALGADADKSAGKPVSRTQELAQDEWEDIMETFTPDAQTLKLAHDDYHGSYRRLFARRAELVKYSESSDFYGWAFLDTIAMMLMGMGLLQLGVLTSTRSRRFYATMAAVGFGVGLPLSSASTYALYLHRFDPVSVAWITAAYDPGRLAVALGHIALVMLVVKACSDSFLVGLLGSVGRMALTNYLTATLICTTLFNGHGLGLFGSLRRYQLYGIVVFVWCSQLLLSRVWLRAFHFGPAEWLWRSLTYWKPQRMCRQESPVSSSTPTSEGVATRS